MRANVVMIGAVLLAGCSDNGGVSSGADTTVPTSGPRFIAAAPVGTIVFSSNRYAALPPDVETEVPDFELYVVNPDGTDLFQITDGPGALVEPRWSPDGKKLAFIWTWTARTHRSGPPLAPGTI